jgi:two-component system, LytTR family, response regulator LytT
MKMLIIEDEPLAAKRLQLLLQQVNADFITDAITDSIEEASEWLSTHAAPDIIFMDINLADGLAFRIFENVNVTSPVIFTTAFDEYALTAFKCMGVDYLLKPVTHKALQQAVDKLLLLQKNNNSSNTSATPLLPVTKNTNTFKNRFTGKIGNKLFFIEANSIACFCAEGKIVYLVTTEGVRYNIDYTLEALIKLLNPSHFFRINRSTIVQAMAIEQVKPYLNSRLKVILKSKNKEDIIVSRERVNDFKKWAEN